MLKYKCLVLDHDDTVVQTERSIGYPYFRDFIAKIRPGQSLTFSQYVHDCNNMVFSDMCRNRWSFTPEEEKEEYLGWKDYSRQNIPPICPGIDRIIHRQKELGGLICVSSLSTREIIQRDFMHHFGFLPDAIYDYDLPAEQRKPETYALTDIIARFHLSPADLLMVDDMKLGYLMAKKVHVPTAYAGWSKAEFPDLMTEMKKICNFSFDSTDKLYNFLFE